MQQDGGSGGACASAAAQLQMNCEVISLEPIEVERIQVKEVLKVLLHSVIFQRALGEYRHRDCHSELFELTYVRCDSQLVDQKVEEQASPAVATSCLYKSPEVSCACIGLSVSSEA